MRHFLTSMGLVEEHEIEATSEALHTLTEGVDHGLSAVYTNGDRVVIKPSSEFFDDVARAAGYVKVKSSDEADRVVHGMMQKVIYLSQ